MKNQSPGIVRRYCLIDLNQLQSICQVTLQAVSAVKENIQLAEIVKNLRSIGLARIGKLQEPAALLKLTVDFVNITDHAKRVSTLNTVPVNIIGNLSRFLKSLLADETLDLIQRDLVLVFIQR